MTPFIRNVRPSKSQVSGLNSQLSTLKPLNSEV